MTEFLTQNLHTPRSNRLVWSALAAVLLMNASLGLWHTYALRVYQSSDEMRHVKYARIVADGKLTTIKRTAAANHPPLYYYLAGKIIRNYEVKKNRKTGVREARHLSVFFGTLGILYIFLILRLLCRGRPEPALLGALLVASLPAYANVCASVANDALGLLVSYALIHAALVGILKGPSGRWLVVLTFWCVAAGLTRLSTGLLVPPAVALFCTGYLFHREDAIGKRIKVGILVGLGVAVVVLLSCGWFYLRNHELYGDFTGAKTLIKKFRHVPKGSPLEVFFNPSKYLLLYDHGWVRLAGRFKYDGVLVIWIRMMALPAMGCLLLVFAARRRIFTRAFWSSRTAVIAVSIVVFFVAVLGPLAIFHGKGGSIHTRYALSVAWIPAGAIALGAFQLSKRFVPSLLATMIVLATTWVHETYALVRLKKAVRKFPIEETIQRSKLRDESLMTTFIWMAALALALTLTIMVIQQARSERGHRRSDGASDESLMDTVA
ncbi:MAG: glycosyltransferase family 39 protein [Myxococcota bacterium]|nr:glycosyltransferase family 39 protein [Myxococcota bacterium]